MFQRNNLKPVLTLAVTLLGLLQFSAAADTGDEAIKQAVTRLVRAEAAKHAELKDVETAVELPSSGLPLSPCREPEAFLPHQGQVLRPGRFSVGLRCTGEVDRYVQVRLIMRGEYLELSRALMPGDIVTADSIRSRRGDLGELPRDVLRSLQQAIGKIAVRRLDEGTVLRGNHLRSRPLVKRGQNVAVESRGRGFVVRRDGVAMENGGAGDRIRVRMSPREILEAVVDDNGQLVLQP